MGGGGGITCRLLACKFSKVTLLHGCFLSYKSNDRLLYHGTANHAVFRGVVFIWLIVQKGIKHFRIHLLILGGAGLIPVLNSSRILHILHCIRQMLPICKLPSYRNQSTGLQGISVDWFLYDSNLMMVFNELKIYSNAVVLIKPKLS